MMRDEEAGNVVRRIAWNAHESAVLIQANAFQFELEMKEMQRIHTVVNRIWFSRRAPLLFTAAALMSLGSSATAQRDSVSMWLKTTALSALASRHATAPEPTLSSRRLVFDPTILRSWYESGIRMDTTSPRPAPRDSSEIALLAAALSGRTIRPSELAACVSSASLRGCTVRPLEVIGIVIGEPRVAGNVATVLLRSTVPRDLGNGRLSIARSVSTYLARFTRTGSTWTMRCLMRVATDFEVPPDRVAQVCGPPDPLAGAATSQSASITAVNGAIDGFVPREIMISPGIARDYRLFIPPNYDRRIRYPLVVWLHGGGGMGTDNARQIQGDQLPGTRLWTSAKQQAAQPAFVLVPQASRTWYYATDSIGDPSTPLGTMLAIVRELEREFSIDSTRLYIAGQSVGGEGIWGLISSGTTRFAAAIIVCPSLNPRPSTDATGELAPRRVAQAAKVPMWVFVGNVDAPILSTRRLVDDVKAADGSPRYTEYAGVGHSIWDQVFREPGLAPWLFAQRKRPGPK
jgi:predicted esterase